MRAAAQRVCMRRCAGRSQRRWRACRATRYTLIVMSSCNCSLHVRPLHSAYTVTAPHNTFLGLTPPMYMHAGWACQGHGPLPSYARQQPRSVSQSVSAACMHAFTTAMSAGLATGAQPCVPSALHSALQQRMHHAPAHRHAARITHCLLLHAAPLLVRRSRTHSRCLYLCASAGAAAAQRRCRMGRALGPAAWPACTACCGPSNSRRRVSPTACLCAVARGRHMRCMGCCDSITACAPCHSQWRGQPHWHAAMHLRVPCATSTAPPRLPLRLHLRLHGRLPPVQ